MKIFASIVCDLKLCYFQESKLNTCPFSDDRDIIRNLLKTIATDDAWVNVTWEGTDQKISFCNKLGVLHKIITDITAATFPEKDMEYWNSRIKTFLRHCTERIGRKNKSAKN